MNPWPVPWKSLVYRTIYFSFIFSVTMIGTNIACFFVWENTLPGRVYFNSDDGDGDGYLNPGGWVGSSDGFPVITVNQVVPEPSMSDPDELKAGWSIRRLLVLWWCMFGSTVIVSTWLGLLPWLNLASIVRRMPRSRKIALAALIFGTPSAFWLLG